MTGAFVDSRVQEWRGQWRFDTSGRQDPRPRFLLVPFIPLPWGFSMDTLLYGTVWLFLLAIPLRLRVLVRRMRGRCARCAYDLRGDFDRGCPECGWRRS
jgi:hypothetical protein